MRLTAGIRRDKRATLVLPPTATSFVFPAPTGGWNTRDPLGEMEPSDALILDNYFPTTGDVVLRGGSSHWATGMPAAVETMLDYSKGSSNQMWAFSGGGVYDVTLTGAVGAPAVAGLLNNRWQNTVFTSAGDSRAVMVNGVDHMLQFDGTTWASITGVSVPIAITGVTTSNLVNVWQYASRLFFCEVNSLKAWYLPVDSFGGAAASIDLGTIFSKGGYLMAGGTWTRDGGDGMDDLCIFVSSKGEVAIFQGTDPSNPNAWAKIGVYVIGSPIGRRCLIKTGADLAIISLDGIVGLSNIISLDRAASNKVALSNKIVGTFSQVSSQYNQNFGWEALSYPGKNQVIFNIPIEENSEQHQYVLNALTGAWCRFKGWNANAWCLHIENTFFGDNNGVVWKADDGDSDNNQPIAGLIKTAFSYMNSGLVQKVLSMALPIIFSNTGLQFGISAVLDFDDSTLAPTVSSTDLSGLSIWNVATWNVDPWATNIAIKVWRALTGTGRAVSILFSTNTRGYSVRLTSIQVLFEKGGIV